MSDPLGGRASYRCSRNRLDGAAYVVSQGVPLIPREDLTVPGPVGGARVDHPMGVVLEAIVRLRTKQTDEAVEGNRADAGFRNSKRHGVVVNVDGSSSSLLSLSVLSWIFVPPKLIS
jgi:hypothetical protein